MVTHAELVKAFGSRWVETMPPETIGQVLLPTASNRLPAEVRDDIMILCGMGGYARISRTDYRIYWYERGNSDRKFALVNTSLERFLETAYRLQVEFDDVFLFYDADEDESQDEIADELRRLVGEIRDIDPPSFDSPAMFWQHVVLFELETFAEGCGGPLC